MRIHKMLPLLLLLLLGSAAVAQGVAEKGAAGFGDGPTPIVRRHVVVPWAGIPQAELDRAYDEAIERTAMQTFVTIDRGALSFHDCWDQATPDPAQRDFIGTINDLRLTGALYESLAPLRAAFVEDIKAERRIHRRGPNARVTASRLTSRWRELVKLAGPDLLAEQAAPLVGAVLKLSMATPIGPAKICTSGRCDCAVCSKPTCDCQTAVFQGTLMVDCKPPRKSCNVTIYQAQPSLP